jgi:uncharacterized membrane protein
MTIKQYKIIELIAVVVLAAFGGRAIVWGNFVTPLLSLAVIALMLSYLRGQVKEVIEDERDIRINGKAARWAIQVYGFIMLATAIVLYASRAYNPMFVNISSILAYSVCLLLILVGIFNSYLKRYGKSD